MATITRFEDIEAWQLGRELKPIQKLGAFMNYLQQSEVRGRKFTKRQANPKPQTRNPKPETGNQ